MITLSTPTLLFSATSLVLLAYTNRFFLTAALIRDLKKDYTHEKDYLIIKQIRNLDLRVSFIRWMQLCGILSLFISVLSMFLIYLQFELIGNVFFGFSLTALLISLAFSAIEIFVSIKASKTNLEDIKHLIEKKRNK